MRNRFSFTVASFFTVAFAMLNGQSIVPTPIVGRGKTTVSDAARSIAEDKTASSQKFDKLPLSFERHGNSEFVARGRGYAVDIHGASATIAFPVEGVSSMIGMEFLHGRQVAARPEKELPGKVNYILGSNPGQWRLGLPTYERVTYHDLYPGIDVAYYGNQEQLEFDLMLKPGADVRSVRMRFRDAGKLKLDPSGSLVLGSLRLMVPIVIQRGKTITARYKVLRSGEVAFEMSAYDRGQPLIIDPTLVYSARLGGGNSFNQGSAIALDGSGNAYIAGYTHAADFPVVKAAFAGYGANGDGFISKVNSTGTALIYSTYIGGSGFDYLRGIAVDSTGAAWAVGYTASSDFPLLSPYQNVSGGGYDVAVVKLDPSGVLAYSSYLGGSSNDEGYSVAVDPAGNAYVTGFTQSSTFPTTMGVYEPVIPGVLSPFITKFSSSGFLRWSTFAGGNVQDFGYGIAVDDFGNSYITGLTYSTSFPGTPPGGAQTANKGGDAFVAKLNFNGSSLLYFTFLGGSGLDQANAISVDPRSGIAVVAGQTTSTDLATSSGALQSTNAGGYDGFVAKLNAAGSAFVYITYLGGNRNDFMEGLAVDPSGNAYVTGYTDSNTFPTNAPIQAAMQGNSTSLFHTSNTGVSWAPFDVNIPGRVSAVQPDPVSAGATVVSTENGIYRTTNGGGTWTQQFSGNLSLSRSPAASSIIYGASGTAIYQSTDNGGTWSFKGSLPQCCASEIHGDPVTANAAYVIDSGNSSFGIYKTVNGGASWVSASTGLPANAVVESMATGSDGSIYVGLSGGSSPGGIYKSTNQGAMWVSASAGLSATFGTPPHGLVAAANNPSILYATDYFHLYESTNAGTTWTTMGSLPGGTVALAISSTNSSTLYYGAYNSPGQLWVSTNSGGAWSHAAGVGVTDISLIVPDPRDGAVAYALGQTTHEAVVAKIDTNGQHLLYSTYLGDGSYGYGIAADGTGGAFVTGYVTGFPYNAESPVTPGALQDNRNVTDGFVARVSDATAACTYSVDPSQSLEIWYSHYVQYSVTAPSGCSWTASSDEPWATIASGASGSGSGVVSVLANNMATTTQSATLTIAGQAVTLQQRSGSCHYNSFSPEASVVPSRGGPVVFNVAAGAGCAWTITNNDPTAITIVSDASGTGNGTVTLNVASNLGPNTRTFNVSSPQGGQESISQPGTATPAVVSTTTVNPRTVNSGITPVSIDAPFLAPCTYSLPQSGQSFSSAGGIGTFAINTAVNCGWIPTTNASWLNTLGPWTAGGGTGTGKVTYVVSANTGGFRQGNISVGGQIFTVTQAALTCSDLISPTFIAPAYMGGIFSVSVNAPRGCSWTATSNVPWITITSGSSGSGGGTVVVTVSANTGGTRTGTVTIAGQAFAATQGAAALGSTACGAADVTSKVSVVRGGLSYIYPTSYEYSGTITVTSSTVIPGPVYLVLIGLPNHQPNPNGTGIIPSPPTTTCFSPLGDALIYLGGTLNPGQKFGGPFLFFNQSFGAPQYSYKVLSGTPLQ